MGPSLARWSVVLLLWCPLTAAAGGAALRIIPLPGPPKDMAAVLPPAATATTTPTHAWLRAPHHARAWYALELAADWHHRSPPLLVIHDNTRARVTVYLPPDYRPRTATVFDATLDPSFSHAAVVYLLPPGLDPRQPVYLRLGDPGQTQPIRVGITDVAGYRARDLAHVRLSTFLVSVQVSMVLVILCFWVVLRDRVFLYFIAHVSAQVVYDMAASGELFALPGAALLGPFGYHTGQTAAALAAGTSIWFILEFADLRRHTPRLATLLAALRWPFVALALIVWMPWFEPDAWLPNTVNVLLVAAVPAALVASWLAWRRGNRQAGFFLLAWVPLLALTLIRVVQLIVGLPLPSWLEYGLPAGMAYAAVVVTLGLADATLQVRHERDQATHIAEYDALTGVLNRRAIMQRMQVAWHATRSGFEPLAVLFLDIDHFKQINDTYGHAAGDACLMALTGAIRAELAAADRVGRYGGEEFVVLLHGDSARMAEGVAARIVARTAALQVAAAGHLIGFTLSIGVALREASMANVDALVECADAAQYRAKGAGRNRVEVWCSVPGRAAVPRVG
ncbi:MAG TPA: diguanylate cyclase [Rhodanobacteraceae bacterium]|nr:diguanylate cyclase [Rhodanobacteraceae bacterium]